MKYSSNIYRTLNFILYFLCFLSFSNNSFAQGMAVNSSGTAANASALLDVSSTAKGVLIPRLTTAQRNAIVAPATSLLIYQTDGTPGYYYNSGTSSSPVWTQERNVTSGTAAGDMLYWNGSAWTLLPAATNGQILKLTSGIPAWTATGASLTTTTVTGIGATTASGGGNISSDGGASVTARGVCYSTNASPTVALSTKTSNGTGTGSFTSSITGLAPGTTYYVRAYATNSTGTSYGPEAAFTTSAITIGASYGGGVVAYILAAGDRGYDPAVQHGLIAAPSDQTATAWGCTSTLVGATTAPLGNGANNTAIILSVCGSGNASATAHAVSLGGFSDWYLPSKDELNKLYISKASIGGFGTGFYWSSTENTSGSAWDQSFNTGAQNFFAKTTTDNIRAVRNF